MIKFAWHVHHGILVEPLTEPLGKRVGYIKKHKSQNEIATRLRLLKPVKGKLPTAVVQAWKAFDEARKPFDEAGKAFDEAWKAFDEAGKPYREAGKAFDEARKAYHEAGKAFDEVVKIHEAEILVLHARECPNCPWDNVQQTIFPEEPK